MNQAKIWFFGAAEVADSNHIKKFQRRKEVALLSYLLVSSRQYSRDHLAAIFWPDLEEKDARNNLRVALSRLSKRLSSEHCSLLISDRQNVQVNPAISLWLDISAFDSRIAETKKHEHDQRANCPSCFNSLKKAVELYRGNFLEGFGLENCEEFEDWRSLVREQYRLKALAAFTDLSLFCEHTGDYDKAEDFTRESLRLEPLSEDANRRLMRLLSYKNKRNAALEHFNAYQVSLQDELGIEPEDATIDLFHQIQAGSVQGKLVSEVDSSQSLPQIENNLPIDMTTFVGRENDLARLEDCLKSYRLITLLGIGGTGKTRLAIELARRQLQKSHRQASDPTEESFEFSDGVYFVSLELTENVAEIPLEFAKTIALKLQPVMDAEAQIFEYLQDKSMLIIFDNFEHLTSGDTFVSSLLKAIPAIKVVATSRQKLAISAEAIYRVFGLDYDSSVEQNGIESEDALNSAAKLFVDSARRVALELNLNQDDLQQINKVCQLTEGHPLAIVLAASWFESLSCAEIFQELSAGVSFLETEIQDVPERHKSIFTVFNSSWQLLNDSEQGVYMGLTVFRGGFDRKAAGQIAEANLGIVSKLLNRSLIQYIPEQGRYEFHNLMHQFVVEKTMSTQAFNVGGQICHRHAEYFLAALETWETEFQANNAEPLLAFEREFENVRIAWEWAVAQGRIDLLDHGINGLRIFCTLLSRYQALVQMLEPALQFISEDENSTAKGFELKLLVSLGTAYISVGGFIAPEAKNSFERATRLSEGLDTSQEIFATLNGLAAYYWCIVDFDSCLRIITQWHERLSRAVEESGHDQQMSYIDDAGVAVYLIEGAVRYQRGEFGLAQKVLSHAISLYQPERHIEYIASYGHDPSVFCRYWLARSYWVLGRPDKAKNTAQEAVDIAQGFEHPFTKMFAHCAVLDIASFAKQHSTIEATAEIVSKIAGENDFAVFQAIAAITQGLALCSPVNNDTVREQGLAVMEQSLNIFNIQMVTKETYASHVVHVYIQEKLYDKALSLIDETLQFSEVTNSNCANVELLHLKAKVYVAQGLNDDAEELFIQALEIAAKQEAKLLELRATTSYAVYLQSNKRSLEARSLIADIYSKFDEGFATADLQAASAVLKSLEHE